MPNPTPLDALTPDALERLAALCDMARGMKPPLTEADYDALSSLCRAVKKAQRIISGPATENGYVLCIVGDGNDGIRAYWDDDVERSEPYQCETLAAALGAVGDTP